MKTRRTNNRTCLLQKAASLSVVRAIAILDHLHRAGPSVSVAKLCRTLRIPRSSAYQIVEPLVAAGLVERTGVAGGIALGRRLYEFGLAYGDRWLLLQEAPPVVNTLRDETGETAQLTVLDRDEVLVVFKAESNEAIHVATRLGLRVPINWSAAGRLLLSDLTGPELRQRLPDLVKPSPLGKATTDVGALVREIQAARRNGVAIQLNQSIQNIGAIAAPIIDGAGRCIAVISILVPVHRLRSTRRRVLAAPVIRAARQVSARLADGAARTTSDQGTIRR